MFNCCLTVFSLRYRERNCWCLQTCLSIFIVSWHVRICYSINWGTVPELLQLRGKNFNNSTVVAVYPCRLAFFPPLKQWFSTICTLSAVFCIIVSWSCSQYWLCFKSSIVSLITQLIKQATFKYKSHVNVLQFNHIMVFHLNFGWSSECNVFVYMQKKWGSSKPQSLS